MAEFEVHPKLVEDTLPVCETALSSVLLMNDSRFPWVILVPRRPGLRDLHDLSPPDRIQLMTEMSNLSEAMRHDWAADKTNVAALGNMVPQLHVHVIMRYVGDAAWPGPVWGVGTAVPYAEADAATAVARISACLRAV